MSIRAADGLFPPRRARAVHHLAVADEQVLHVEESGSARGIPLLFLHGGPGSGCNPRHRRLFDPDRFRTVLFDQRGCGRSRPRAAPGKALAANTTAHLIADIEAIRRHLGIERWLVHGGSWGALLALAYTQAHPARVAGVVLRGSFLGTTEEVDAYLGVLRDRQPVVWQNFVAACAGSPFPPGDDPVGASLRLLSRSASSPAEIRAQAAAAGVWLAYESLLMGEAGDPQRQPGRAQMAKTLLQGHYLANHCFCNAAELLAGCAQLAHIPAVVIHGLDDPVCPPASGKAIGDAWPGAAWWPIGGAGHGMFQPAMAKAIGDALTYIADRRQGAVG